jgi:signal transduction histidine kinase
MPGEFHGGRPEPGRFGPGPHGRWLLEARSRSGSLESVVEKARMRNLFVILALLALIVAAGAALVRYARRAQHLAEMEMEFVAGVSHELRTPLAVMRTAGFNLSKAATLDADKTRQYGALIRDEAEKLGRIVEQVLRFSNTRAGRVIGAVSPVPVERLVEEAAAESHTHPEQNLEPGLPPVLADETALRLALQNLLSNAAKYGGDWVGVRARRSGEGVEIAIADRGPGIPADELPRIFDPFYRGRRAVSDQIHGTGLGLSLVKRIVEAHSGNISVTSVEGSGSEFVIHLPAADGSPNPAG